MKKPKTGILTRHEVNSQTDPKYFSLVSVEVEVIVDNQKSLLKKGELLVSEPAKLNMKAP